MSIKYLIPAALVTLLAGCASNHLATSTDPVRARVLAELDQARKDGSHPPSEADYVTPNWVRVANPAGTVMSDGHLADAGTGDAARTVKGGDSTH